MGLRSSLSPMGSISISATSDFGLIMNSPCLLLILFVPRKKPDFENSLIEKSQPSIVLPVRKFIASMRSFVSPLKPHCDFFIILFPLVRGLLT